MDLWNNKVAEYFPFLLFCGHVHLVVHLVVHFQTSLKSRQTQSSVDRLHLGSKVYLSWTRSSWPRWACALVGKSCQRYQQGLRSVVLKPSVCKDQSICFCLLCLGSIEGGHYRKAVATVADSCYIHFVVPAWKGQNSFGFKIGFPPLYLWLERSVRALQRPPVRLSSRLRERTQAGQARQIVSPDRPRSSAPSIQLGTGFVNLYLKLWFWSLTWKFFLGLLWNSRKGWSGCLSQRVPQCCSSHERSQRHVCRCKDWNQGSSRSQHRPPSGSPRGSPLSLGLEQTWRVSFSADHLAKQQLWQQESFQGLQSDLTRRTIQHNHDLQWTQGSIGGLWWWLWWW